MGAGSAGYRLGLVARVTSWIGMLAGVILGTQVLPPVLRALADATAPQLLLVTVGTLLGMAFIGQAAGLMLATFLHVAIPSGSVRQFDRVAGAVAGVLGVVLAAWMLLPLMADVPGWVAAEARTSTVARVVHDRLPDSPDAVDTLRRLVGDDGFPRVFGALDPAPTLGPPPTSTNIPDATLAAVVPSTVKVSGVACSRVQEGSGFVVAEGLVATNAHVVAGESETNIERSDGSTVRGQVVMFDPRRDLAIVRVPDLNRPALPRGDTDEGGVGAVFGHPGGGALRAAPFSVGDVVTATGTDIYDRERTERSVLVLSAALRPGDSGAALIDPSGAVVGVAFAVAPDKPGVAYALDRSELEAVLARDLTAPVVTGPCLG